MVTATAPASPSPSDPARSAASLVALERLKKPFVLTEAQKEMLAHLDAARQGMKDAPKKAAAAKVAQLKTKLMALKLASGVAAATGDIRAARATIREVLDLLKALAKALRDAGILTDPATVGPTVQPSPQPSVAPADPAAGKEADPAKTAAPSDTKAPAAAREADPAEIAQAREDAKGIVKELRKIVARLRLAVVAAQLRGADPKEVKEAEKSLRDAEKELESLADGLGRKADDGGGVDLRA